MEQTLQHSQRTWRLLDGSKFKLAHVQQLAEQAHQALVLERANLADVAQRILVHLAQIQPGVPMPTPGPPRFILREDLDVPKLNAQHEGVAGRAVAGGGRQES